jgi:hypothetical protein
VATQQGNMELGTRPYTKRVAALPVEGALSPNNCATSEARLSGEALRALLAEGALSPNNCSAEEKHEGLDRA